jgi:recombination protein RecA
MAKKKKDTLDGTNEDLELSIDDDKEQQIALAKKAIFKKYGDVIHTLEGQVDKNVETLSTGSLSLDAALGNGGFAFGRICEIFGPQSSGKTTLAVNAIIQAQRRKLGCLYVDAEHALDPKLMHNYGVDLEKLEVVQGYDGEENLEILESLIKTGGFSVAVVDSVSALIPRAEAEADMDQESMALLARLMSKALRKIVPIAGQTKTLVLFINQVRSKVGRVFGNPEVTSGGAALGFFSTHRLSVRGGEAKDRRLIDPSSGEVYGHRTEIEVIKNKLSIPYRKANINLIYGQGYDNYCEILDLATNLAILEKTGAWYKQDGVSIANGEAKMLAFLRAEENKDFYISLKNTIADRTGLKECYEQHLNPGILDA